MLGGASGEVRPTLSGSDAGAYAPGTKRKALPRRADTVRRFWNSFVGANGCSPEEVHGETGSRSVQRAELSSKQVLKIEIPISFTSG